MIQGVECNLDLLKYMSERVRIKGDKSEETFSVLGINWETDELLIDKGGFLSWAYFPPSSLEIVEEYEDE